MNIFYLDNNINKCVQAHCDKHVVKMVLETAQILSTVIWIQNESEALKLYNDKKIYKKTHINHPCVKWAASDVQNAIWLCHFGLALADEYNYRYNREHASKKVISFISQGLSPSTALLKFKDTPPSCVDKECLTEHPVLSYRLYYQKKERDGLQMKYTKRNRPEWLDMSNNLCYTH